GLDGGRGGAFLGEHERDREVGHGAYSSVPASRRSSWLGLRPGAIARARGGRRQRATAEQGQTSHCEGSAGGCPTGTAGSGGGCGGSRGWGRASRRRGKGGGCRSG